MQLNRIGLGLILGLALVIAKPLTAHHSFDAEYDSKKLITVTGYVTKLDWVNPHAYVFLDVKDESGNVKHWTAEWNNPSTLVNFGFTARTFKAGEEVTVTLSGVAKSGAPIGRLKSVLLPDGILMTEDESVGK